MQNIENKTQQFCWARQINKNSLGGM